MNANTTTFGDFLQRKREESNFTLRKMADLLGLSAPFLSDVEKGHRNPPALSKLEQISDILGLTTEDERAMYDLAGKKRGTVAPDLPEYIMSRDYVVTALRIARDLNAGEEEWMWFVRELEQRKG